MAKSKATFDDAVFRELRKKMGKLAERAHVKVGVLASRGGVVAHGTGNISLVELAAVHEFGSPAANIPERSFIRSTFREAGSEMAALCGNLARGLIADKLEIKEALEKLGAWGASRVKKTIRDRETRGPEPQENKPETIKRKGSSTPLVDTGQLVNSITWEVGE